MKRSQWWKFLSGFSLLIVLILLGIKLNPKSVPRNNTAPIVQNRITPAEQVYKIPVSGGNQPKVRSESALGATDLEQLYQQSYRAFHSKKYSEAIKLADQLIKEDKGFYKAYNIKGIALCFSHNFSEGMTNIDQALTLKPDFGYARFNKALAYELYRNFDSALVWYDKALEVENYVWSYYGKASIYGRRGDVQNTVKYLKIAISMWDGIRALAREESDFDPVRNTPEFKELVGK